jgi:hypothetical protein
VVSGSMDSTSLVWDVAGLAKTLRPARATLPDGEADRLWPSLAGDDAERAFAAIRLLCEAPADSLTFLKQRLKPVGALDGQRVSSLIADLDAKSFSVRQKATSELEKLGDLIVPIANKAMENASLEVKQRLEQILRKLRSQPVSGELLAAFRGIEILEHIGSRDARELLSTLAGGAPGSRLTESARQSLQRLSRRESRMP